MSGIVLDLAAFVAACAISAKFWLGVAAGPLVVKGLKRLKTAWTGRNA